MSGLKLTALEVFKSTRASISLARSAEKLGYYRHWLTEHQPQPSPLGVLPLVGASTRHIRLGTAGIQLRYYPAPIVAFDFRQLVGLFGGRIDAGVAGGRTVTAAQHLDFSLGEADATDDDVYAVKTEAFCRHARATSTTAESGGDLCPELWIHGASIRTARRAAKAGTGYGHGLHLKPVDRDAPALAVYRNEFEPRAGASEPKAIIAVAGVCAETDAEAARLEEQRRGRDGGIDASVVGSPRHCTELLHALADRYAVDEIAFMDLCNEREDTLRSYQLLAEALRA